VAKSSVITSPRYIVFEKYQIFSWSCMQCISIASSSQSRDRFQTDSASLQSFTCLPSSELVSLEGYWSSCID
jgi:hypothetical protein